VPVGLALNNDAYLRRIDRELRRLERDVFAELRPLLVTSIVTIRRLIVAYVPDDGMGRNLAYAAIKPRLEEALVTFNDTFALRLSAALEQLQSTTLGMAFDHLQGDGIPFVFLTADQWLDEVRVFGGWTLREYFRRRSPSQFMKEIMRLVDRTVQRGLMQGLPTEDIARQIVPEVVSRTGRPSLTIRKGTILNAIRNRVEGTIAQAIWTVATHSERQVWQEVDVRQWIWSAILDERTCPICTPLDGVIEDSRDDFPYSPPVHPNCRCRILPFTLT
jgi:SPP1 gp7 family putative phage head morphogenesis protein